MSSSEIRFQGRTQGGVLAKQTDQLVNGKRQKRHLEFMDNLEAFGRMYDITAQYVLHFESAAVHSDLFPCKQLLEFGLEVE
ncbi:hypothetical protein T265_10006 [Opisthorchis viverrini]|uniref:Uncharacterized protein n=1 Tax=Opisthorchis viverrini TaxID=6198 RepID=A0A075A305_OPIVI|nr:hypothetical protein T265_10006 [Opisthorchis viverrini]KER21769.1 hypothetical protein T265_10006 [Opisthorchis viverrini]